MPYILPLNIADANSNLLWTVGTINLMAQSGTYLLQLDFVIGESLAAPVILGCDFCTRFVEAIPPWI